MGRRGKWLALLLTLVLGGSLASWADNTDHDRNRHWSDDHRHSDRNHEKEWKREKEREREREIARERRSSGYSNTNPQPNNGYHQNGSAYPYGYPGQYPYGQSGYPYGYPTQGYPTQSPYPQNRGYGNYGYGNAGYGTSNQAYQTGFQDGLYHGQHDRQTGHSNRPTYDSTYSHADRGYPGGGNKAAYQQAYRNGYLRGYQQGYGGGYRR